MSGVPEPFTLAVLAPIAASWTLAVPVASVPALTDVRAGLQAVLAPTAAPLGADLTIGADLTNSVAWTLGQ